ncbi:hypothetical protein MMC31_006039 [Peltigera leucophlebia]|nr:hypothetical protein [Peltigera leucophlebia]
MQNRYLGGHTKVQIVEKHSAVREGSDMMYLGTDHSGLNNFSGEDDPNFKNFKMVCSVIEKLVREASLPELLGPPTYDSGNIIWLVPRIVNNLFTGRAETLTKIMNAVSSSRCTQQQRRYIITGMGGQGKSEICLQIANTVRQKCVKLKFSTGLKDVANVNSFWGVFWVDISSPSIAKSSFTSVARSLGSSVDTIDDALQLMSNLKTSWLLILDNADDPDFDYQGYFPSGDRGIIIMTSRVAGCSRYETIGSETLTSLDREECVELLFKAAEIPKAERPSHTRVAENVVSELSFHTLTIMQAGAYIAGGHCPMEGFPKKFRQQHARLLQFKAKSRYSHVFATFEASASVLEENINLEAKDALRLLEILAILHFSELSMKIFEYAWKKSQEVRNIPREQTNSILTLFDWHFSQLPGFLSAELNEWDDFRLQEASNVLASLFLITKRRHDDTFEISMHSLIHSWARNRFNSKEEKAQAWLATGSVLSLALSLEKPELWHTYDWQLRPHAQSYLSFSTPKKDPSDYLEMIVPMLLACAQFLENMRDDKILANLLQQIFEDLRIDSNVPSAESIRLLPLYKLQAINLQRMGQNKYALQLFKRIFNIQEIRLSEDHPCRLLSQHVLASTYQASGQIQKAVQLFEQVVKIQKTTLREDHPNQLVSQHELASAYQTNGQIQKAVQLIEHVVKVDESTLSEDHPDRLVSQQQLARAYQATGGCAFMDKSCT